MTGCGSSISKSEQYAIDCVLAFKRALIDPGSLGVYGDPIVDIFDGEPDTVYCDVGFKTAGGIKQKETLICNDGKLIGFVSSLSNLTDGEESDFGIPYNKAKLGYELYLLDRVSVSELKAGITPKSKDIQTVSGEKVAKEADVTFVKY